MFGKRGCLEAMEVAELTVEGAAEEITLELDRERLFKPVEEVDSRVD